MAKAKEKDSSNVVELRKNGPSEDAVIVLNVGKFLRASDEFQSANGRYRNELKHIEAKGLNLKALKEARAIKRSGKVHEKIEELSQLFCYLMIMGCPVPKEQLELFDAEPERTPAVERAMRDGRNAGLLGLGMNENPYAIDSEPGQAWMAAWHAGSNERELVLSMEPDGVEVIKNDDIEEVFDDVDEGDEEVASF